MDTKQKKTGASTRRSTAAPQKGKTNARRSGTTPRKLAAKTGSTRTAAASVKLKTAQPTKRVQRRRPPTKQSVQQPAVEQQAAPDVVYTQAVPFNRNRLLLRLASVVAVVLAISFGISIFFKVENVTVSGNEKYSAWTVLEASGIKEGDSLLSFGKAKASGKITAALPYVESVRIGIKLPKTVNIEIKELDVVYSIKDSMDSWWLMTAEGRIVDRADSATAGDYTQILGVKLSAPASNQQAVAQETPAATDAEGNTLMSAVRASDQLTAALSILQFLEQCGIIGEAATVDVADLGNIELWYGQRYQVLLGDTTQLKYKIDCMNSAINGKNSLKEYDSGILDISFFIKEDQIVYEPFA